MVCDENALQAVRESRLLINQVDAWLFAEFEPYLGDRILEIGCGLGNLLALFANREWVVGIETSQESVNHVQEKFANQEHILAYNYNITDPHVLELAAHRFDCAVSLNVFEHIEEDQLAIRNVYEILQPEGCFIMIVPAHERLYGSMDRSIGHYRRYNKGLMHEKMTRAGFQVQHQKYINMPGALGWWFNGRILKQHTPPEDQLKTINRFVPLIRKMEGLIEAPFGISLLTIAKKV